MCPTYKFLFEAFLDKSLGSSVSVGTGLQARRPEFNSRQAVMGFFLFTTAFRPALGPPILLSIGYRRLLTRWVKQPGREADHSSPSSAEVNVWNYTSTTSSGRGAWLSTGTSLSLPYLG
jgi:hypothetical protein